MDEGLSTIKTSEAERIAAISRQLAQVDLTSKDQDTAFLIELIGGLCGFLGVGYIYSGLTNTGIVRLVGYWLFGMAAGVFLTVCGTLTLGIGFCLALPLIPLHFAISYFSANDLKKSIVAAKAAHMGGSGGFGAGSGYLGSGSAQVYPSPMEQERRDEEL